MTRKICMIVHQYPPDPGATAYRMAYRARFLCSQGYEVDIFAPGTSNETQIDSSGITLHRVRTLGASSPADMDYTRLRKNGKTRLPEFLHPLAGFLRWLPPLISRLRRFDGKNTILYTYNNPVTLHVAALAAHKGFHAWVCEFRDPIAGYEYSARGQWGRLSDAWLEKQVLRHASVICMRQGIQSGPEKYAPAKGAVVLLPDYGIDLDLFATIGGLTESDECPVGVYAGTVFSDNPFAALSSGLDLYRHAYGDAEIHLFGPEHHEYSLHANLRYGGYIGFQRLLAKYQQAQFLIAYDLSENKTGEAAGFVPSKLAELIAARRPILFIGNQNSVAERLIADLKIGICARNEPTDIAAAINKIMIGIKNNRFSLAISDEKRKLIDARAAEQVFVNMLSGIRN